ncbi:hypothetical protein VIGAN_08058900 [Vigna angularis var. angularis]|uniref:Homeobox domain-containing protein n=2 Tax=Phaseolus angularis TaxID=3914 RepID=A0A0S3SMF7_PHAAN|nr:homeobox-leucine zipper protein MERISTEM L1 [Vigna angularis]XP_052730295.1 homeobox-leucine zipper protein MERISTEM L1 [Vigna angularis]BAT94022.1 hypothetical protein VIGAN_08058900 [Vigna angularis var. angularis]
MYQYNTNSWNSQQQQQQSILEKPPQRTFLENELGRNIDGESSSNERRVPSSSDRDPNKQSGKKRYHRHTHEQIMEMECFFKECPHPDDRQRRELSRELGLDILQVKFWFQNKRTQVKSQHDRHENNLLKAENDKLRAENTRYKEALSHASCPNCGGLSGEMSFDEQQLRTENMRLREEIEKMSAMIPRFAVKPGSLYHNMSSQNQMIPPPSLDQGVGNYGAHTVIIGEMLGANNEPLGALPIANDFEKDIVMEIGSVAMKEFTNLAEAGNPLWLPGSCGCEILNQDEYLRSFPKGIGPTPLDVKIEASRQSAVVIMDYNKLVEIFMDVNQWANMFCGIISRAAIHQVLEVGQTEILDGACQVMSAEFQVPSPLVPVRDDYFVRFCKRKNLESWTIVDFSMDQLRPGSFTKSRRRPSGCLITELPNGYSKIVWIEHIELEDNEVHDLYKSYVNSGLAFGAKRWVASLDRQCERLASSMATNIPHKSIGVLTNSGGRRSMMRLAERMMLSFCTAVGASTANAWTLITDASEDVRVMTRKSVDDPGRPSGIVLSASTSLWLPIPSRTVFDFLRSENSRNQWDILSNGGQVEELAHIANGHDTGNCVSLLRVNTPNFGQSNMTMLQETCTDATGSFVVYAPVDLISMNAVLRGGNPDCVALLPSGFAVLPDGPEPMNNEGPIREVGSGGCLLTVAFQILVDSVPTSKLSATSVTTVSSLIKCIVERIQAVVCSGGT